MAKLGLDEIMDLRGYERIREEFRREIIDHKKTRRVTLGPILTALFESKSTIRFQIQEMARAEKMISDEAITQELDTYEPLVPKQHQMVATVFIELVTKEELMHWLPLLVGIEKSIALVLNDGEVVRAKPEKEHESQLTRSDITSTVHYITFDMSEAQVGKFTNGDLQLMVDHPDYQYSTKLSEVFRQSILSDWAD
ncbi:MAG: DUF3501 family protein [Acidimicrobiaceae bacterium]|nr:DUF3501 family protein [Acidimicrobiaceae bacterium]